MLVGLIFSSFFIFQIVAIPTIQNRGGQEAAVVLSGSTKNIYKLSKSKDFSGVYNFNYLFNENIRERDGQKNFDAEIVPFKDAKGYAILTKEEGIDKSFGAIRDFWNYPVKTNVYQKLAQGIASKSRELSSRGGGTLRSLDQDPVNPGIYNCRANTSVTGYFKAYFEEVALANGEGYDDPSFGQARREEACQVLQDISELIKLDETNVTPDILFTANINLPSGVLAAASSYVGYYQTNPDNGSLHKHILTQVDPTPTQGVFDAFVMTNFDGVPWDVDSTLSPSTYDFYTTLYHEVLHTLGFTGTLPSVINQTGVEVKHNTFDFFSYKHSNLQNSFIDQISNILNVAIGAPSSWFTTNEVVYRGIKNYLNATPDGTRPVYSPSSWQQGSSLSHFDMSRSGGQVYVMNQSLPTNTSRTINDHEKEVLCHAGYQVDGMSNCELETPVAQNDLFSSEYSVCVDFSLNDYSLSGGNLTVHDFDIIESQLGDQVVFNSAPWCAGGTLGSFTNAKSFWFYPGTPTGPREYKYQILDSVSNRISFPAYIKNSQTGDTCINTDPDDFICNGDFELGELPLPSSIYYGQMAFFCPSNILPWCPLNGSVDIYERALSFLNPWVGIGPDTYSGAPNNRYLGGACQYNGQIFIGSLGVCENAFAKTKTTLVPGNYSLSFRSILANNAPTSFNNPNLKLYITDTEPSLNIYTPYVLLPQDLSFQMPLNMDVVPVDASDWQQYFLNISIPNNGIDYKYVLFDFSYTSMINWNGYGTIGTYYIDDVHLEAQNFSTISGNVYHDLNQNGIKDANEQGLDGVDVSVYTQGQTTPLQTVQSESLPNDGLYTFSNLPNGSYYVVVSDESLYAGLTEPAVNAGLLVNHDYVYSLTVNGGQVVPGNDFGIILNGDPSPEYVNIHVKKSFFDSTLSIIDRSITWNIEVTNFGPDVATNINISDVLPSGLTYVGHTTPVPNTYNSTTGNWNIPSLGVNQSTLIKIKVKVPLTACGTKTNVASLTSVDQIDTISSNNQSISSLKLKQCDIIFEPNDPDPKASGTIPNPSDTGSTPVDKTRN